MAKRRQLGRAINLPWEQRGAWLRDFVRTRRWRVLAAAAIAALLLLFVARSAEQRQRVRETRASIAEIKRALAAFRADLGRCPHSLYELMHPPRTGGRRYLRHIPVDGWGRAFFVRCPGRYDPEDADVVSAGASGSFLDDDNLQ
ncbi:MAG: type II secretion system protein GspG [Sandaracinaceae bacterium]